MTYSSLSTSSKTVLKCPGLHSLFLFYQLNVDVYHQAPGPPMLLLGQSIAMDDRPHSTTSQNEHLLNQHA